MNAVTHLEKVIVGEASAVTHLEKVIAGETSAVTYTEKVITGEAPPITHLQRVIAGVESPVTHLEYVWAGRTPEPTEHEYTGVVPYSFNADGTPLLDWYIKGNTVQNGTPTPQNPIMPQGCGDLETVGTKAGQYKIPISSANTTTPVYLGEVETTRKIKKLVLTGNGVFTKNDADPTHYLYYGGRGVLLPNSIERTPLMCNELPVTSGAPQSQVGISSNNNFSVVYLNFGGDVMNAQPSGNTAKGLKEYLAAQYAAGTPVTVWYVLATEETGIVNEPLRKIGDYADTLSMEQAGVQIPTNRGNTVIDVETTLKPSEVYIKYKGV